MKTGSVGFKALEGKRTPGLANKAEGKLLDKSLPGHASVPVKDIFNPPFKPLSSTTPTSTKDGVPLDKALAGHGSPSRSRSGG